MVWSTDETCRRVYRVAPHPVILRHTTLICDRRVDPWRLSLAAFLGRDIVRLLGRLLSLMKNTGHAYRLIGPTSRRAVLTTVRTRVKGADPGTL